MSAPAPGFLRASGILAAKDLRLEARTWETLSSSVVFSLIVLVIFNFGFGFATVRTVGAERLVPGVLWSVIAFASVVGMTRSLQLERQHDTLGALFMAPIHRSAVFVGKFSSNLAKLVLLELFVVPLSAVFFDYDLLQPAAPLALVLLVHSVGMTELGTLFAAVATRLGRGEALLATLLFPAAAPLFISAVKCTTALLAGQPLGSVGRWMAIAIVFDVLYFLVALSTFEFVLEE